MLGLSMPERAAYIAEETDVNSPQDKGTEQQGRQHVPRGRLGTP
jgi:hypothetical protein